MGMNLRYSPLEYERSSDRFNFSGADIYNVGMMPWQNPTGAQDYFVDLNVKDEEQGDGTSWDEAKNTIAAAITLADTSIGFSPNRWWARRNRIFALGDGITEALTVAPEKTDLIGLGYDIHPWPRVTGNMVIATAVSGFRIFNMGFIPTSTSPIIQFPSGMHGFGLHNVHLMKSTSYTNSASFQITDCRDWVMDTVFMYPDNAGAYNTIGFNIAGTSLGVGKAIMRNSVIYGTEGINVVDTGNYIEGAVFHDNVIVATNLCIDENSDCIAFINNHLITAAAAGSAAGSGVVDWNAALVSGNLATTSDNNGPIPDRIALAT